MRTDGDGMHGEVVVPPTSLSVVSRVRPFTEGKRAV